tara:strand:+ start:13584 stop:15725 length:2142 start_codon:yes stop_codon:yes gene_type:complete
MTFAKYPVTGGGGGGGLGDVVGPASATDSAVVLFDGTTGKLIKNSTLSASTIVLTSGNQTVGGIKTFSSQVLAPTVNFTSSSNQMVFGSGTFKTTISAPGAPAADLTYTFPNIQAVSLTGTVSLLEAANQTFSGSGTIFSQTVRFDASSPLWLGTSPNRIILSPGSQASPRTWLFPDLTVDPTFAALEGTQSFSGSKTFATITLPSSVTYTSNGSIVKSGVGALTFTNASAAGLTFAGTGTVTAPTGTYTLAGLSLGNVFTVAQTVSATTNQIVLGTTNTTTINSAAPAASRTYNIIDAGGAADFVMTAATQTIGGAKTFSSAVTINPASNQLVLASGVNALTLNSGTSAAARTYTVPDVGATGSVAMLEGAQTFSALKTFSAGVAITGGTAATQRLTVASTTWTIGNGPTITEAGAATFATSVTSPLIVGGSSVSQVLTIKSTTGIGTSDRIDFVVGNNGAVTGLSLSTSGRNTFGPTSTASNTGQPHLVHGGLNSGATGLTDAAKRFLINVNTYQGGEAWAVARDSNTNTLGGVSLNMLARTSDTVSVFSVQTNNAADGNTAAAKEVLGITQAGAVTLNQIHNRTDGNINSGRYTPTLTGVTNIAGVGTTQSSHYVRVGNTVTASVTVVGQTATAAASTTTRFAVSLPIASNFTVDKDACGSGSILRVTSVASTASVVCLADVTNDRIDVYYLAQTTSAADVYIVFQYEVK